MLILFSDKTHQDTRLQDWERTDPILLQGLTRDYGWFWYLCGLWIRYYFPLMASPVFIPQMKSESAERISGLVVSFRLLLEKIT